MWKSDLSVLRCAIADAYLGTCLYENRQEEDNTRHETHKLV